MNPETNPDAFLAWQEGVRASWSQLEPIGFPAIVTCGAMLFGIIVLQLLPWRGNDSGFVDPIWIWRTFALLAAVGAAWLLAPAAGWCIREVDDLGHHHAVTTALLDVGNSNGLHGGALLVLLLSWPLLHVLLARDVTVLGRRCVFDRCVAGSFWTISAAIVTGVVAISVAQRH